MNILAIGAHPDDIEFGCAHVLMLEARKGNTVKLLVLSKGEASSNGTPENREAEARAAAKIMGAEIQFVDLGGDCHLQYIPENAYKIASLIREFKPAIMLAPHTDENQHPDHAVAGRLARDACRFARYGGLDVLRRFSQSGDATHAVGSLYFYSITKEFGAPNLVVDIGPVFDDWVKAMECYESQMRTRSYADLRISAARNLGLSIGASYAAGLYVNDPVRVAAISELTLSSRHY
jgi:bacillithiol biosynthesis deacetylase BshB1